MKTYKQINITITTVFVANYNRQKLIIDLGMFGWLNGCDTKPHTFNGSKSPAVLLHQWVE